MATKTISLELDAYEKLRRAKRAGESFSAVVRRARFGPSDSTGASVLEVLDGLPFSDADRAALAYREEMVQPLRSSSPSHWEEELR